MESTDFNENNQHQLIDINATAEIIDTNTKDAAVQWLKADVFTKFGITDLQDRRSMVRKIFALFILQNFISIPIMEFYIFYVEPIPDGFYNLLSMLLMFFYASMYPYTSARRHPPMNYAVFILITLLRSIQYGFYAHEIGSQAVIFIPVALIVTFSVLIVYSNFTYFRFTNFRAVLLSIFTSCMYLSVMILFAPSQMWKLTFRTIVEAVYLVYATQILMSGECVYNLQPNEHVFAISNTYVDLPRYLWLFLRAVFVGNFLAFYGFMKSCCCAEVC